MKTGTAIIPAPPGASIATAVGSALILRPQSYTDFCNLKAPDQRASTLAVRVGAAQRLQLLTQLPKEMQID